MATENGARNVGRGITEPHVAARERETDWRVRLQEAYTIASPRTILAAVFLFHTFVFLVLFKLPPIYYEGGSDTEKVFWPAAQRIMAGHIPYIDPHFFVEYPPLATAVSVLPALFHPTSLRAFDFLFAVEILLVDGATLLLVAALAGRIGVTIKGAAVSYGLLIPALGAVSCQRFDLIPAMLVLGATLALAAGRSIPAWLLLCAATLIKLYPVVVLPLFLLYDWRHGRRRGLTAYVLASAAAMLAWLLTAPASVLRFVHWESQRGIEIESVQASIVQVLHLAVGLKVSTLSPAQAFGSWDLVAAPAALLGVLSTLLLVGALVALYAFYGRDLGLWSWTWSRSAGIPIPSLTLNLTGWGRARPRSALASTDHIRLLLGYGTLVTLVLLLTSKLFSVQFSLWVLPLLAVQPYDRKRVVFLAFLATVLSQVIFPYFFDPLIAMQPWLVLVLALRNGLLIAIVVLIWRALHREGKALRPLSLTLQKRIGRSART